MKLIKHLIGALDRLADALELTLQVIYRLAIRRLEILLLEKVRMQLVDHHTQRVQLVLQLDTLVALNARRRVHARLPELAQRGLNERDLRTQRVHLILHEIVALIALETPARVVESIFGALVALETSEIRLARALAEIVALQARLEARTERITFAFATTLFGKAEMQRFARVAFQTLYAWSAIALA